MRESESVILNLWFRKDLNGYAKTRQTPNSMFLVNA